MKAILRTEPATMNGRKGTVEVGLDALGPYISFEGEQLTTDDASMADTFIDSRIDLHNYWEELYSNEYVFEAGVDIAYEGTYNDRLFRKFTDAEAYAKELQDGDDADWGEVYIRPVVLS